MNYLNEHLYRKESNVVIGKSSLNKGMIVSFRYHGIPRMGVILNRNYQGKMHCLQLNDISVSEFNELASGTGIVLIPKFNKRGLNIPKVEMPQSSRRFYFSFLKGDLQKAYRTFFLNEIHGLLLIDYKFNDDIEKMFG